jgi:hypothetical protein
MRKTEVQKAAFNAFNAFALACNSATQALRETLVSVGITTLEDAEPLVTAWASERYSVGLVESKSPRNKGEMVLDRSAPGFEAAKKARYRILEALKGDADSEADNKAEAGEAFDVPAEIAALAARLVAACREYDLDAKGLKRLAAQAVAEAFKAK